MNMIKKLFSSRKETPRYGARDLSTVLSIVENLGPEDFKRILGKILTCGLKSNFFGYPAGIWPPPTPAREYIAEFLFLYMKFVKGHCLEFNPPVYKDVIMAECAVTQYDVWNVVAGEGITIVADLQKADIIKNNTFDSIIFTHVLSAIPDPVKAVSELNRIVKPGGIVLCTVPCVLQKYAPDPKDCWRFTIDSLSVLFSGFSECKFHAYGNAATVAGSPYYLMKEHFPEHIMKYHDENCPSIVAVAAWK